MGEKKDISIMRAAKSDKGKKAIICICVFLSEFFGTFMLLFLGCMSSLWGGLGISWMPDFQFGLVFLICFQVWGMVSGCHINPAVTLGAVIYGVLNPLMALLYVAAQILGALCGYATLKGLEGALKPATCLTVLNVALEEWQGLLIEFCLTGAFMLALCAIWDPRNEPNNDSTPIRIGMILSCICIAGSPFTGASINPARTLAPAIYHNEWGHHWIYWLGPLGGAACAALFYRFMFKREEGDNSDSDVTTLDAN